MKVAVLDLGTNTFHLLIAEVSRDHTFKILLKTRAVVKLGLQGLNKNEISENRFRKGLKIIRHFHELMQPFKVSKTIAYATSAIRSSTNGREFVKKVKAETGISVRVISGDEEAELIYFGIRQCVSLNDQPVLIMDIGGGSTEFIIANHKKIFWKQSFNIGASRLLEKFNPSDPITGEEIEKMQNYLGKVLSPLIKAIKKYPVTRLIGSSGSFETLAEMISYRFNKKPAAKTKPQVIFNLDEYNHVHQWLLKSTIATRKKTKGLVKMRVDMIVISSICTNFMLKKFRIREMVLSKYALKEGALWKLAHAKKSANVIIS